MSVRLRNRRIVKSLALVLVPSLLLAAPAAAPDASLLITTQTACTVFVDGDKIADLPANGVKKLAVPSGEHLVVADCSGRRSEQVVTVRGEQKVVKIEGQAAPAPSRSTSAAPVPVGKVGLLLHDNIGQVEIFGVTGGSPAARAGIRAGSRLVAVDGQVVLKADAAVAALQGPAGSTVQVTVHQQGFSQIFSLRRETSWADLPTQKGAGTTWQPPTVKLDCAAAGCSLPQAAGSMYCFTHKCSTAGCTLQKSTGSMHCSLHKCAMPGCLQQKAFGSSYCWLHKR